MNAHSLDVRGDAVLVHEGGCAWGAAELSAAKGELEIGGPAEEEEN